MSSSSNNSKKRFELDHERLATTDQDGNRIYIHPEERSGRWSGRRVKFFYFLLSIYLILPWIYIDQRQIVLLDIARREFHLFGHIFYGHDAPLILFILVALGFFFAFVTSVGGRVWCGWGCPQTVFMDVIYRPIEIMVEGSARERRELDCAPWGAEKLYKRGLKWLLFLISTLHIVHSFLGYFVGTRALLKMSLGSPADNLTTFLFVLGGTAILLFDFGWFREQFCIIACPYGRMQSVLMDDHSLIVGYDHTRGEPRRSSEVITPQEGDCINCYLCVKVCPTGIDIRRGTQMECIACTICIDACDGIMEKVKRPMGLIRYTSECELRGESSRYLGIRSIIYLLGILVGISLFVASLSYKSELGISMIRGSKSPYQTITISARQQEIVNHYILAFRNPDQGEIIVQISQEGDGSKIQMTTLDNPMSIGPGVTRIPLFLRFRPQLLTDGSHLITIIFSLTRKGEQTPYLIMKREVTLVGPL
ncbi:MAG: cytochrome c oxidase accessory protein CcoG [Bdellovibrionales bacterium]|nr:cytochrome c oxidase accessory protein CcoG [Bdellovibrionales bacterium]